jgi:hypothetical protein
VKKLQKTLTAKALRIAKLFASFRLRGEKIEEKINRKGAKALRIAKLFASFRLRGEEIAENINRNARNYSKDFHIITFYMN